MLRGKVTPGNSFSQIIWGNHSSSFVFGLSHGLSGFKMQRFPGRTPKKFYISAYLSQ